jgi:hypothetical protein
MGQPEGARASELIDLAPAGAGSRHPVLQMADHETTSVPTVVSRSYLEDALLDAERLLKYAAEIGIDVDQGIRHDVLQARTRRDGVWDEDAAAHLLAALTKLAGQLHPITAESLKACRDEPCHAVRRYLGWAVCLAAVIVPFSFASFVTSGFSEAIRKDVVAANELTVKLVAQVHPSPGAAVASAVTMASQSESTVPAGLSVVEVVGELQQFASLIRSVDARARRLNGFVFFLERDPYQSLRGDQDAIHHKFQLLPEVTKHLEEAVDDRVMVYQDVRYFAQSLQDDVSTFYGAIATCLLPVLYALLGTCAYLLRSFEQEMITKTYVPSSANSARFLIAGIGGGVVGLFNNFTITQSASIPPLAIAFLVGYAVDVFFAFLEGLLQTFTKTRSGASAQASGAAAGAKA